MPVASDDLFFSLLADAACRRLLQALATGPADGAALAGAAGLDEANTAQRLTRLANAGLVRPVPRRKGWYAAQAEGLQRLHRLTAALQPAASAPIETTDGLDEQALRWAQQWPDHNADNYLIGRRLLRLSAHIETALKEAAASQQLQSAELLLLDALVTAGPPYTATPTQLQKSLLMTQSGTTKCVQRLEQAGLVARGADPTDGRGVRVRLLPQARKLLRNIMAKEQYGTDWVASSQLPPERRRLLAQLLGELLTLADAEARRRSGKTTA
jgi:DNA-binding MarR family transcriptional regulator